LRGRLADPRITHYAHGLRLDSKINVNFNAHT